uniref:Uncharacterized protein n=1 Tax=Rhizophora mucronata TaxID=61149 RepID=A0A2P2NYY0_RHIMU
MRCSRIRHCRRKEPRELSLNCEFPMSLKFH